MDAVFHKLTSCSNIAGVLYTSPVEFSNTLDDSNGVNVMTVFK